MLIRLKGMKNPIKALFEIIIACAICLFCTNLTARPSDKLPDRILAVSGRLNEISKSGVLKIGMQKDYFPFHVSLPQGGNQGIDVKISELLADALGVRVQFEYMELHELLAAVSEGKIDISLGGISSSLERARIVSFSAPYIITTPGGLLAKTALPHESESIEFSKKQFRGLGDIKELGRLNVGVMKDTINEKILLEDPEFKRHKIISFTNRKKLIESLQAGKIDLLVGDGISIQSLLKNNNISSSFIPLLDIYREEHICIVIPHGDPELESYINFFINKIITEGKMKAILNHYLN